jgi:acyl-CoA thioester hydrolase
MTAKPKLNPLFFAPFVSSVLRIEPEWIDENGHLNMAYYNVLFETAIDEAFELVGLNQNYYRDGDGTIFIGEAHVRYRREVHHDTPVRVTVQLVDYDVKRLHLYLEMRHAKDGWLAATSELMALHINKAERKVGPFPADILDAIAVMQSAHAALPRPEALGSAIGIPSRGGKGKVGLH